MSSSSETSSGKPVSLEQLIALNDEILAIVRAGVPLELGLRETGRDLPGAIGDISLRLALRMSRGESLPEALAAKEEQFPRIYRAVVEAGLKAGHLPAALESISSFARHLVELRRRIGMALLYPWIVLSVAYALFLVFLGAIVDRFHDAYEAFRLSEHGALRVLIAMQGTVEYWGWIVPVLMLVLICWWIFTGSAYALMFSGFSAPLGWIPGVKSVGTNFRWASFSDLLAMLVEHRVPLPEGILLSAEATGDARVQVAASKLADALTSGQTWTAGTGASEFPPFLRWLIVRGQAHGQLATALRQAAELYRRRAIRRTEWFKLGFPILAGVVIGGGATMLYALTLFLPLIGLLKGLS